MKLKSITNIYKKISTFGKILLFVILLLIIMSITSSFNTSNNTNMEEGFEQRDKFIFKKGGEMYDQFYANVYDFLINDELKSDFEIGTIINSTNPSSESIILDVGCGTGSCVSKLNSSESNLEIVGIDSSPFMIKKSIMKYPDHKFVVGDALDIGVFSPSSFTHILCLDLIIYYFEDKRAFFNNCIDWLMPGGYLILHVVDRDKFDPILSINPSLYVANPQQNGEKNKKTKKLKDFTYSIDSQKKDNKEIINEKFQFNNGNTRKQEQILYMEDKEELLTTAQQCGFTLHAISDIVKYNYGDQYIYVFVKP